MGSNPAAPTNFSKINNELGRYGVKAALLALDFGTKFGAKIIPILLHLKWTPQRLAAPREAVFVRDNI